MTRTKICSHFFAIFRSLCVCSYFFIDSRCYYQPTLTQYISFGVLHPNRMRCSILSLFISLSFRYSFSFAFSRFFRLFVYAENEQFCWIMYERECKKLNIWCMIWNFHSYPILSHSETSNKCIDTMSCRKNVKIMLSSYLFHDDEPKKKKETHSEIWVSW